MATRHGLGAKGRRWKGERSVGHVCRCVMLRSVRDSRFRLVPYRKRKRASTYIFAHSRGEPENREATEGGQGLRGGAGDAARQRTTRGRRKKKPAERTNERKRRNKTTKEEGKMRAEKGKKEAGLWQRRVREKGVLRIEDKEVGGERGEGCRKREDTLNRER